MFCAPNTVTTAQHTEGSKLPGKFETKADHEEKLEKTLQIWINYNRSQRSKQMGDKAAAVKSDTDEQRYQRWLSLLPKHWRQYASSSSLRRDFQWFRSLLNAYDMHGQIFLKKILEPRWNGELIPYPRHIEDEDFDNSVLKSYSRGELHIIPTNSTRVELTHMRDDIIENCREKKMSLIKLGEILSGYKSWKKDVEELNYKYLRVQQSLELEREETLRLNRQIKELKQAHHQSENEMSPQLDLIAKEKEDLLIQSLELEREDTLRLNRQIEDLKKAHHQSENKMSRQLKQITKEKEDLLIRLSKIAGAKLTTNNPDIADLSNDNRPTKLAEKFGQLYDDAWTDSLEELTEVEATLDETVAISFLLRIVMTAYQFCRGPRSMFLDLTDCQTIITCKNSKDKKVLTKLPESSKVDIQPRTQMSLHAKETVSEMQRKFHVILKSIIRDITRKEKFRPSVSDKSETNPWELDEDEVKETKEEPTNLFRHTQFSKCKKKNFTKSARSLRDHLPRYGTFSKDKFVLKREDLQRMLSTLKKSQKESASTKNRFAKTTHFAERCVELCWFMQTTRPPIHLSACIPYDGKMNNDIFRAYTKSGEKVDYIVWPVMYLYENGPVLNKGIAQPK